MKRFFRVLIFLTFGAILIWTLYFLYKKSESKPVLYSTQSPFTASIVKKTVATGAVVPRKEVNIKPRVSGIIEELYVIAGDRIHKGDKIARIKIVPNMLSLNEAENRLSRARTAYDNARQDYERNKKLYDAKLIATAEFQPFQLAYSNAQTEIQTAENNLQLIRDGISKSSGNVSNTIVRSTIDGMVLDVPLKEGSSVIESNTFNEGTTIASVADMGEMIFEGKVDESEVGKIRNGMELIMTIGAIDQEKFDARLEYIAPKGVKENGAIQFQIKARLKLKKDFFIRAGYSANADIVLDRRDSVMAIPEALLQFEGEKTFVEVERGPQVFEKRYIKTGLSDGINIEVVSGLDRKDKIKDPNSGGQQEKPKEEE